MNHGEKLGTLTLSYDDYSTTGLDHVQEDEIVSICNSRGIDLGLEVFTPKPQVPDASMLEPAKLIVVIAGSLAVKTLLQELVKDLYRLFKKHVGRLGARTTAREQHFALLLDITSEGRRYRVGVDFMDDQTLVIAFYRLHEYVSRGLQIGADDQKLVELEYPKVLFPLHPVVTLVALTVPTLALFALVLYLLHHIAFISGYVDKIRFETGYVVTLLSVWTVVVIVPRYR
jgi:hypothetical protein